MAYRLPTIVLTSLATVGAGAVLSVSTGTSAFGGETMSVATRQPFTNTSTVTLAAHSVSGKASKPGRASNCLMCKAPVDAVMA